MSLVSTVITDIGYGIEDTGNTRFSSDYKLALIKIAIRRANKILQRNGIQFAKKYIDLTTTDDVAYLSMPDDLDVDIGLWNTGTHESLTKLLEHEWEETVTCGEMSHYMLDYVNSRILIKETPNDSTTVLRLWYYPTVDPSAYTSSSTMPWGGRCDDAIAQYVIMRLLNVGELDTTMETSLLQDMEAQLLEVYRPLAQTMVESKGWL